MSKLPKKLSLGQNVKGYGVYLGKYTCGDVFNLFALPKDLEHNGQRLISFNEAQNQIAALNKASGFDTKKYDDAKELITALQSGEYKTGWVMPTFKLMAQVREMSVPAKLSNTFRSSYEANSATTYWTSTTQTNWIKESITAVNFSPFRSSELETRNHTATFREAGKPDHKFEIEGNKINCRPILLVPVYKK